MVARAMHLAMLVLLVWLLFLFHLGPLAFAGVLVVTCLLIYEHSIVSPGDLRRLNAAFFTLNGVIACVYFGFMAADVLTGR